MEGSNNPGAQLAGVWGNMLSQATASGMSRDEICEMTVGTVFAIADTTRQAMFPDGQEPVDSDVERATEAFLDNLVVGAQNVALLKEQLAGTDAPDATANGEG